MGPALEAIKGGGGSIKVGTTGTISALMSRELESAKTAASSENTHLIISSLVPGGGANTSKRFTKPRASAYEASTSGYNANNKKIPEIARKTKHYNRKTHQIPMLYSGNISVDATPFREKPDKRVSHLVDIVDVRCGHPDRKWASPITSRLRKLGFSKLSESFI